MDARNLTTCFPFKRILESACSIDRRGLRAAAAASLWLLIHNCVLAQSDTKNTTLLNEYEQLLRGLASDEAALNDARGQRERRALVLESGIGSLSASVDRAFPPSSTQISQRATSLIIYFEVSGEAAYRKQYKHPEWPGEQSGVTVGIGYDLGYASKETFKAEWQDFIDQEIIEKLSAACRVKGGSAAELARSLRGVEIDWPAAFNQYTTKTQPIYVGETEGSLPNTSLLSADSLGALVSIVYNRGSPFNLLNDRYAEMRNIKAHMRAKHFDQIPNEIRSMKRLWPNSRGLRDRREAEAKLFEIGLLSSSAAGRATSTVSGNSPSAAKGGASGSSPSPSANAGANTPGSAPSAAASGAPSTPGSGPNVASAAPSGTSSMPVGGTNVAPGGVPNTPGSGTSAAVSAAPGGTSSTPVSGPNVAPNSAPSTPGSTLGSEPNVASTPPSGASSAPLGGTNPAPSVAPSVGGSRIPSAAGSAVSKTRPRVEIVLTNGRVLRVDLGIDPEVLARLVAVIDR